jgi:hypothetical protein
MTLFHDIDRSRCSRFIALCLRPWTRLLASLLLLVGLSVATAAPGHAASTAVPSVPVTSVPATPVLATSVPAALADSIDADGSDIAPTVAPEEPDQGPGPGLKASSRLGQHLLPSYNSDFFYYFMRHGMDLDHSLVGFYADRHAKTQEQEIRLKAFLPLVNRDKVSFFVPVYFDKYQSSPDLPGDTVENDVYYLFGQAILEYRPTNRFETSFIVEHRVRGDQTTFDQLVGNDLGLYVLGSYQLSENWTIAPAARISRKWEHDGGVTELLPTAQLYWHPNPDLKTTIGVPGLLGVDWAGPAGVDLSVNVMMDLGSIEAIAAVRKRWSPQFETTIRYLREGYSNLHLPERGISQSAARSDGPAVPANRTTYTNATQLRDKIQLELGWNATQDSQIQLVGGYAYNDGVELSHDDTDVATLDGTGDGAYFGVNLTSRLFH